MPQKNEPIHTVHYIETKHITCYEREKMQFEIDYYKRAYKLSQQRVRKLTDAHMLRRQRIVDYLAMTMCIAVTAGILMLCLAMASHWAEYGW